MNIRKLLDYLTAHTWDRIRPLAPQHRSREAWFEHCAKNGTPPDGL